MHKAPDWVGCSVCGKCRETSSAGRAAASETWQNRKTHRKNDSPCFNPLGITRLNFWTPSDSYAFTQQTARHYTAGSNNKNKKNSKALTLSINRSILLNLYSILFCTDGSWLTVHQLNKLLQQEQHIHRHKSCKHRGRKGVKRSLFHTHFKSTHMHDQWQCGGSRGCQHEATNNNEYSTSLSFPSTWKHTHCQNKKKGTREHVGFAEYNEVECDSAAEGFGDEKQKRRWKVEAYSSNVRKAFCMSSRSWA